MGFQLKRTIFLVWFLLSLIPLNFSKMNINKEDTNAFDRDDEISYALSELSVDDLNALSQLVDIVKEEAQLNDDGDNINSAAMSDEKTRFKREIADASTKQDLNVINSNNVNAEYIRQLEDSFPNVIDQANQDGKENIHIRVKRD